jgi:hypothetical protein
VNACDKKSKRDSIAFSNLPASASSYLATNYSGYTAIKAFVIKDKAGTVTGYVAIIQFNGKPVAIKFDAAGAFVKVLEQRDRRDMHHGPGWQHGGSFDCRDGKNRDTIALNALPAAVASYMASNHGQDTLIRAFRNKDNSIVIISANNGIYATVFGPAGQFIKRTQLPAKPGRPISIAATALPATVQTYLTNTYPNYALKHAFKLMGQGGVVLGYVVMIDANNTKYAVEFDSNGGFLRAVTIR